MSGFISSNPFQNTKRFLQIRSLAPSIARRSSRPLQLRRQLRRAITPNPCIVCQIRGYHCVRLVEGFVAARSVHRLDPRISGNRRIWLQLRRVSSSPVSLLHGFEPKFFISSLLPAQPLSLSPPAPGDATLHPCALARPAPARGAAARDGDGAAPAGVARRRGPSPHGGGRAPPFPCAAQAPSP
jgi:hypothetical protein